MLTGDNPFILIRIFGIAWYSLHGLETVFLFKHINVHAFLHVGHCVLPMYMYIQKNEFIRNKNINISYIIPVFQIPNSHTFSCMIV